MQKRYRGFWNTRALLYSHSASGKLPPSLRTTHAPSIPSLAMPRLSRGQSFRTTPSSSDQAMQPDRYFLPTLVSVQIDMYLHTHVVWRGTPQMTHPTFLPYPAWWTLGCDTSIENTHKLQGWQLPGRKVIDVPLRPCSLWSARHSPVFL